MSDAITCPDPTCQAPARIVERWTLASAHGLVEHVKTSCGRGHWFTPAAASLELESARRDPLLVAVAARRG